MLKSSEWSNIGGGDNSFTTKVVFAPTSEEAILDEGNYTSTEQGIAITNDGYRVIMGVPQLNKTFIYLRTGSTWSKELEITAGSGSDGFGSKVAINSDGSRCVIGTGSQSAKTCRIYSIENSVATLEGSIVGTGNYFPHGLSISGNGERVIAGDSINNRVIIHKRVGVTWSLENTIVGDVSDSYYGTSVSMNYDSTKFVVGTQFKNLIDIYKYNGTTWNKESRSTVTGATIDYGYVVSMDNIGNRILVGSASSNKAWVHDFDGTIWSAGTILPFGDAINNFGRSVAISGNGGVCIVGSPSGSIPSMAYVFKYDGSMWGIGIKIIRDPANGIFGNCVDIDDIGSRCVISKGGDRSRYIYA